MRTSAPNQKVGAEVLFATQKIYHKKNYSLFDVLCVWVEFSRLSDDRCMLTKYLTNVASDWAVRRNLFNLNESYEIVPAIWAGYPKCTSAQYCKSPELPNQLDSLITIFSIFVPRAIFYKFAANPCPKKSITTYLHMSWMHNNQLIALWAHFIKDFIIFFIQYFDHTSYYLKKKITKNSKRCLKHNSKYGIWFRICPSVHEMWFFQTKSRCFSEVKMHVHNSLLKNPKNKSN